MKIIDGDSSKLILEVDAEESIGLFFTLLHVLDQIDKDDFSTLLHFRPDTAYQLMKQLQKAKVDFELDESISVEH